MKRLPVVATIKKAFLVVWQKRLAVCRALIVTGLVLAALNVAQRHFLIGFGWVSLVLANAILYWVVFTLFAITCHRIVLLGDTSVPEYGLRSWTSREARFFGWGAVVFLYVLLIVVPVILVAVGAACAGIQFSKGYEKYWGLLAAVPAMYVVARLAVLFPATAVGERRSTDWAFKTTAKNGWRLVITTSLIPAALGFAISALPVEHSLLADFLVQLVRCALMAIGIAALSLSFRFLSPAGAERDGADRASQRTAEGSH